MGEGDQQVFPRQGLSRLADVALLLVQSKAFLGREGLLSAAVRAQTQFSDLGSRRRVCLPHHLASNPSPQLQHHLSLAPDPNLTSTQL